MDKTVSDKYRQQLKDLHKSKKGFGIGSVTSKHYPRICSYFDSWKIETVLDYGCGKGNFIQHCKTNFPNVTVSGFDVASDEFSTLPAAPSDLVVCLDVLEHVEFGTLSNVFADIRRQSKRYFICSVANYAAGKTLPDGRNAHVTQLPFGNWFDYISIFFQVQKFVRTGINEGLFICTKLKAENDWR